MKVLKTLEKVLVYLACALGVASLALSNLLDESHGVAGMVSYASLMTMIGVGGVLSVVCILVIGTLLYFNKNDVVRKIALGLVISAYLVIFFISLSILSSKKGVVEQTAISQTAILQTAISPVFALISGILFVCSVLCGFIYYIVNLIKPCSEDKLDPSNDKKIALVLKWKKLMEDGIITEDEFTVKRNELLEIK